MSTNNFVPQETKGSLVIKTEIKEEIKDKSLEDQKVVIDANCLVKFEDNVTVKQEKAEDDTFSKKMYEFEHLMGTMHAFQKREKDIVQTVNAIKELTAMTKEMEQSGLLETINENTDKVIYLIAQLEEEKARSAKYARDLELLKAAKNFEIESDNLQEILSNLKQERDKISASCDKVSNTNQRLKRRLDELTKEKEALKSKVKRLYDEI